MVLWVVWRLLQIKTEKTALKKGCTCLMQLIFVTFVTV